MTIHRPLHRMLAAAGAGALATLSGLAAAQSLAAHDSNAPVNYAADRIELQDRQNRVVLSGDVQISQSDLRMSAERTTVSYRNAGSLQIDRIDAIGGVRVVRGNESASGDAGVYDFNRRIITLVGNVALRRGGDTLNGGRLVIDLASGRSFVDGRGASAPLTGGTDTGTPAAGGGRVSGSFAVPERRDN